MALIASVLAICAATWAVSTAEQLPSLYWNVSNPLFADDSAVLSVRLRDRIDIYCPFYEDSVDKPGYLAVYMVSAFAYRQCTLYDAKPVVICKSPRRNNFASVVFREFTPNPNGLEFSPGETYYLISTSTGESEGLYNRAGGLCSKSNLRLRIKVRGDEPETDAERISFSYVKAAKSPKSRLDYQLEQSRTPDVSSLSATPSVSPQSRPPFPKSPKPIQPMRRQLSALYEPLGKMYKERSRLRYLMSVLHQRNNPTTTQRPYGAIEYVIGYEEGSPNFLRSSCSVQAGSLLLTFVISLLWLL